LAVQFADASGQTLVAFVRPGRCNVYTHPERISAVPSPHR
jgi:formate dehydrogenase assembly factor FdhD